MDELKKDSRKYKFSEQNLFYLYKRIFNKNIYDVKIIPAPTWKILKGYGGHKEIDEYRNSHNSVIFTESKMLLKPVQTFVKMDKIF